MLCVHVAAAQVDGGESRLLVGTHGGKLHVYSCTRGDGAKLMYALERTYTFSEPVVAVQSADILGDGALPRNCISAHQLIQTTQADMPIWGFGGRAGVLELVVLTSYSCHVLQPSPIAICARCYPGVGAPSGANEKSSPRGAPMQHLAPRRNPEG